MGANHNVLLCPISEYLVVKEYLNDCDDIVYIILSFNMDFPINPCEQDCLIVSPNYDIKNRRYSISKEQSRDIIRFIEKNKERHIIICFGEEEAIGDAIYSFIMEFYRGYYEEDKKIWPFKPNIMVDASDFTLLKESFNEES